MPPKLVPPQEEPGNSKQIGSSAENIKEIEDKSRESEDEETMGDKKEPGRIIGEIEPYIIGEDFEEYLKRYSIYINFNKITEDNEKSGLLLMKLGNKAVKEIESHLALGKTIENATYTEVVASAKSAFVEEKNESSEAFYFNKRCLL